jgi:hypothetical protein
MDKEYLEGVGNRHEYLFGSFDEKRGSFSGSQRWLVYGGNFASIIGHENQLSIDSTTGVY